MNTKAQGQCLCGAVQFTAQLPLLWVAHCHCTRCQRAHGAAFVTWVGFHNSHVKVYDPRNQLKWFHATTPDAQNSERGFCSQCGSPMFFKSTAHPNEIHIAHALFTTSLKTLPQSHVHYDTHVDWAHIAEQLPCE